MAHVPPHRTVPVVFLLSCVLRGLGSSERIPSPYTLKTLKAAMHVLFLVPSCIECLRTLGERSDPETCRTKEI